MIGVLVVLLGVAVALLPKPLAEIFSADPRVIELFVEIRYPLAGVMVGDHKL